MSKKRIMIGGWYNPSLDEQTTEKIKDCGFDFIFLEGDNIGNNCLNKDLIAENLGLLDRYGLKAYVQKGKDVDIETAINADGVFSKYENYLGMLLYDEPSAEIFDSLREDLTAYTNTGKDKIPFINLLPSYARSDCILGNYNAYITEFCEKIIKDNPDSEYLSFDFYPLIYGQTENLCLADRWLHDTYIIAKNAKKYGVEANAFIQAMPFSNNGKKYGSRERIPSFEDLSLQIYVYLAFGFKGLTYFCLGTPLQNFEFSDKTYALFGKNNEETPTYFNAKRINEAVKGLSEVFCDYEWLDSRKIGTDELFDFAADIKDFENSDELCLNSDGKLLIGEFAKCDTEKAVMLVNFGETSETAINRTNIKFAKKTNVTIYRGGKQCVSNTDSLSLALNVGEGVFVTYEVL